MKPIIELLNFDGAVPCGRYTYIRNYMVQVELHVSPAILADVLKRVGIGSRESKFLRQQVHLLSSKGKFYLGNFRMLFHTEGKASKLKKRELDIFYTIVSNLVRQGKITVKHEGKFEGLRLRPNDIFIVSKQESSNFELKPHFKFRRKYDQNVETSGGLCAD